ncbi:nesprin-3-like [Denticeps clupeoides]|uniref:KASH domain-containing protein n=1 Tax=Denticeps clupeoides TaxID=299321 RepID=A0AAY4D3F4_9TELE|nr:nesprin-3-like [Denticeps clupeoides]XP_028809231.1 nesprin-3-like [Denticeps clupeoides]XP_028809232.1 nesprin-3-like [Denticeps clupeoides]
MTQPQQPDFEQSLASAVGWIQVVQERLKANDETRGTREELEARLRATGEICRSEHEGRMMVELVVAGAESLLKNRAEKDRPSVCAKLKELKALWEETSTYISHCHSRLEWVWLHWSEYLKAYEGFWAWLLKMQLVLEPQPELQLGLREKTWHLKWHRVLLDDARHHGPLLERLLEEADVLSETTSDVGVGPEAQTSLRDAYTQALDRAQERVSLLERIAEEHETFDGSVQEFKAWLSDQSQTISRCLEGEDSTENKLQSLQEFYDSASSKEGSVKQLELVAEGVKSNSSPGGAECVTREMEGLRRAWDSLRERLTVERGALREAQRSEEAAVVLAERLRGEVGLLWSRLQNLSEELGEEPQQNSEEEPVAVLWRRTTEILTALALAEPRMEKMKADLRDLYRHSADTTSLSEKILSCTKKFQEVRCNTFRKRAELDAAFSKYLRHLLQDYREWHQKTVKILAEPLEAPESSHPTREEQLFQHSGELQKCLSKPSLNRDVLSSFYGAHQANVFHEELRGTIQAREDLHGRLRQRIADIQELASSRTTLEKYCKSTMGRLSDIREQLQSASVLQPDLRSKSNQSNQLMTTLKELEGFEAEMASHEALVSGSPVYKERFKVFRAEWKTLLSSCKIKVKESKQQAAEHERLREMLLSLQEWMNVKQEQLDHFCGAVGDNEALTGEFLEKELQVHQVEGQGERVMARTSQAGKSHILQDLERLKASWKSLHEHSVQRHGKFAEADLDQLDSGLFPNPNNEGLNAGQGSAVTELDEQQHETMDKIENERPNTEEQQRQGHSSQSAYGKIPWVRRRRTALKLKKKALKETDNGQSQIEPWRRFVNELVPANMGLHERASCDGRNAFEVWLENENMTLSKILSSKVAMGPGELLIRQKKLEELRSHLGHGQILFQGLLEPGGVDGQALEELQYHWMLYKTRLQDTTDLQTQGAKEKCPPMQDSVRVQKKPRHCGFLHRVCCAALPLQILLLSFLFLAFLLPLAGESCSLANNFARSFKLMLHHKALPPT